MPTSVPVYLSNFESGVRVLVIAALLWIFLEGAARLRKQSGYAAAAGLSLALLGWAFTAYRLAAANAFASVDGSPPSIASALLLPSALLIPLAVSAVGISIFRSVRELVSAIPLSSLVAMQVYRVAGIIFLLLWSGGRLPWQFALPAGIGDIATGISGVWIAFRLGRDPEGARRMTIFWCLFGIADLVIAVTMGVTTSPGPLHLLAQASPNRLVSAFPLVMIPTFAVPLALILHGVVLWRLMGSGQVQARSDRQLSAQPS